MTEIGEQQSSSNALQQSTLAAELTGRAIHITLRSEKPNSGKFLDFSPLRTQVARSLALVFPRHYDASKSLARISARIDNATSNQKISLELGD